MENINYTSNRAVPVIAEPEILVIGGGPAGIAAAYCAARRGKKTMLTEREYSLGGAATLGLVGPFMTCSDPDGKNQLIKGFFRELTERMIAAGGAVDPMSLHNVDSHTSWHSKGHNNVTPFNSETLKMAAEEMCLEQNVELLYGVQLIDMIRTPDGRKIKYAVFAAKEGLVAIQPKVIIDCTGDGDAAAFAGCPMAKGDETTGELQAATLFFTFDGADEAVLDARWQAGKSMRFEEEIREARARGEYPVPRDRLGIYKSNDDVWRANITRIHNVDGTKSKDLTHISVEGRKQIGAVVKFLRKYVKGCENIRLLETAANPGVRETRRIKGDYVLDIDSLLNGENFPDAVLTLSNSPDIHTGKTGIYITTSKNYTIPYRALIPSGVDNLLAAGRNISCDRMVLSAIRVMPPCFGMGQAAGNAAALAVEEQKACADIDVAELRKRLISENVVLK